MVTLARSREEDVELLVALPTGCLIHGVFWGWATQQRHSPPVGHAGATIHDDRESGRDVCGVVVRGVSIGWFIREVVVVVSIGIRARWFQHLRHGSPRPDRGGAAGARVPV